MGDLKEKSKDWIRYCQKHWKFQVPWGSFSYVTADSDLLIAMLSLERQRSQTRIWNQGHWRSESLITTNGRSNNRIQNSSGQTLSVSTLRQRVRSELKVQLGHLHFSLPQVLAQLILSLFQATSLTTQQKPPGKERCGDTLRHSCSGAESWQMINLQRQI